MKAQIISIVIILVVALIIALLGLFIHNEKAKLQSFFKWPKFKK